MVEKDKIIISIIVVSLDTNLKLEAQLILLKNRYIIDLRL